MVSMYLFDDAKLESLHQSIGFEFSLSDIMVVIGDYPIYLLDQWRFWHSKKVLGLKNAHKCSFSLFLDD